MNGVGKSVHLPAIQLTSQKLAESTGSTHVTVSFRRPNAPDSANGTQKRGLKMSGQVIEQRKFHYSSNFCVRVRSRRNRFVINVIVIVLNLNETIAFHRIYRMLVLAALRQQKGSTRGCLMQK